MLATPLSIMTAKNRTFVLQYSVMDYQDVLIGEQLKHMVDVMDAKLDRIELNQVYIYPLIYANWH